MVRILLLAALAALAITPHSRAQSGQTADVLAVMQAGDQKDWFGVRQLAGRGGVVGELALWRLLSNGEGSWREYTDFVSRNYDWPNLKRIRREGERAIPFGARLSDIDAFLGDQGVQTGTGALRRADALRNAGRDAEAAEVIAAAWRELSMTTEEQNEIRARWPEAVSAHHWARADNLLWRGLTGEALEMKALVSRGQAALIDARVRLRRRSNGVDAAINAIPPSLADDPGLAYERFVWRIRKDRYAGAEEILMQHSVSAAMLGRPDEWGNRRRQLVRRALRAGRVIPAYNMANLNQMSGGSDYSDLEWLAGWIALRRMREPDRAIAHFSRFLAAVATPISYGRGKYWLGRAYEAKGDGQTANRWYADAARHQTSFYGQLAAQKIGAAIDPYLTAQPDGDWRQTPWANRSVAAAARALSQAGQRKRAHWFLTHLADISESYADLSGAANFAAELGRPDAGIRIAKKAARKGHVLRGHYYPISDLATFNYGVEPALAMAIARQESELNPEAISPAGARGLMQLMPATARKVSGWVGVNYNRARLTQDWQYNATLGQTYLARRMDQFGGSVALAAAAYNAGAGRSDQWIERFGDPRSARVDYIDWIEMIPFRETRNYVQRVLEGLQVYRSRIAGRPVPFSTERDARGR